MPDDSLELECGAGSFQCSTYVWLELEQMLPAQFGHFWTSNIVVCGQ